MSAAMRGDAEGVTRGVNASVRWRRQAACARKAANAAARMRASVPNKTSHDQKSAREDATATVTSDAGGRRRRGTGETTGARGAGARERAEARDPAHDASDHPVERTHLADDDVSAARRVAEPRWTERAANGATRATESATESATIGPVDRASQCGMRPRERRDAMQYGPRATRRREGEYDRTTAANDARRNVLISDDRWTDENSPQTCSGLLVGREFASLDATRTVETMCRT